MVSTPFSHQALLYDGPHDFVQQTAGLIREGVAAGETTMVIIPGSKIDSLRTALGASNVTYADMCQVGVNPARLIPAWQDFVTAHALPGGAIWGIGEPIWAGRSEDELVECQRHEQLVNVAFAEATGFTLVCPYDVSSLPAAVVTEARCSHPTVRQGGRTGASDVYRGTSDPVAHHERPLPAAPRDAITIVLSAQRLHDARTSVGHVAAASGMSEERTQDLLLAVTEVGVNSLTHGRGAPVLSVWTRGDVVLCQVTDAGQFVVPVPMGRQHPPVDAEGGRGLWLAHQLCDLVQVRVMPSGTLVRLQQRA